MAEYDETIKRLRNCVDCYCKGCKYEHLQEPGNFVKCMNAMVNEAANAIEELLNVANAIPHKCEYCVGCEVEKPNGGCDNGFILSPKRAKQAIESCTPCWISVTEQLPKAYKTVVCIIRDIDDAGAGSYTIGTLDNLGDWFVDDDDYSEHSNLRVTHWMPLPSVEGLNET